MSETTLSTMQLADRAGLNYRQVHHAAKVGAYPVDTGGSGARMRWPEVAVDHFRVARLLSDAFVVPSSRSLLVTVLPSVVEAGPVPRGARWAMLVTDDDGMIVSYLFSETVVVHGIGPVVLARLDAIHA